MLPSSSVQAWRWQQIDSERNDDRADVDRVTILERKVEGLASLPARVTAVELQILQLRQEMRTEFSGVRQELRAEIRQGDEQTRRYMRVLHEEVIARIAALGDARR